jgi:hypothetical protein
LIAYRCNDEVCRDFLGKLMAAAAVLLFSSFAFGADETAPVPKPDVKVGDMWSYQFTNLVASAPKPSRAESRVMFVGGDAIMTVVRSADGRESDAIFNAEWNAISLSSGWVYDQPQRIHKFPLTVGETYPYLFESTMRGRPARYRNEGTAKVAGWEDVIVPAGKFRAVKIELRGAWQRLDSTGGAPQRWDVWYVPEVKRMVKYLYEEGSPGRQPGTKSLLELLEFKVQ